MFGHRYAAWAEAIADVVYPPTNHPQPVYLDMERSVMEAIGARLGLEGDVARVREDLFATVRATIRASASRSAIFSAHNQAVRTWARKRKGHPPNLPLLATFSVAAEQMDKGDGLSSANYYGRLAPLLGLEHRKDDLATAYRSCALLQWQALNRWLTDEDGGRGLPTAYSLGAENHRYVGLAMSQALVREVDRSRLGVFFQEAGFPSRADVQPDTLLPLLDAWINQSPSPATNNLERLWRRGAARERIADAASVLLASWDGVVAEQEEGRGAPTSQLRLACTLGGFLVRRFEARVLAYLPESQEPRAVHALGVPDAPELYAQPTGAGPMVLAGSEGIDLDSLLDGVLRCKDSLTGADMVRRPRRIVPLRRDDLLQQHVEVEQAQLGDDLTVLVEDSLLERVCEVLQHAARPGWQLVDASLSGVPKRHRVIRDVQLMSPPVVQPGETDLRVLVPMARSQMVVSGGFSVPGRMRRWARAAPPEVRVVDEHAQTVTLELRHADAGLIDDTHAAGPVATWSGEQVIVADLTGRELEDGDYELVVYRDGHGAPSTRTSLRLRSAEMPDAVQWAQAPQLMRDLSDPRSALTAEVNAGAPSAMAQGAVHPEAADVGAPTPPGGDLWWEVAGPRRTTPRELAAWRLAAPDPNSCLYTGRHYLVFPPAMPGRNKRNFIEGHCRDCGAVKRAASNHWVARSSNWDYGAARAEAATKVQAMSSVRSDTPASWETAMDVLGYLGGGSWSLFERVALQVEASGLFVDRFARSLESLGHVEVRRDTTTLTPTEWEVAPSAIAGLGEEDHVLCGYWTPSMRDQLIDAVTDLGGSVAFQDQEGGPRTWYVFGVSDADAQSLTALDIAVIPGAAHRAASWLPPLSEVVAHLPVRSADAVGDLRWFSVAGARWTPVSDLARPGAYRVRRHATHDVLRTAEDVAAGTLRTATVQLTKHAAALQVGRPLVAYDEEQGTLTVPLGADLPGAYARAAVLASGLLPRTESRRLVYNEIPPHVAAVIVDRLGR